MIRQMCAGLGLMILALVVCADACRAQVKAPPPRERVVAPLSRVTVDGNEAMFTTMVALYASGYEGDVSADHWGTFRAQIRERARQQKGPAVQALREFYTRHQLRNSTAMLWQYVWVGLAAGRAPKFDP